MRPEETTVPGLAREALEQARTVLLIDWHEDVPRSLVAAGYSVLSCHEGWFRHEVVAEKPVLSEGVFAPSGLHQRGYLISVPLDGAPDQVDLVCTFRPPEEQAAFVGEFVVPLGARWFWIERGDESLAGGPAGDILEHASDEARAASAAAGVTVIEGWSVPRALAALGRATA